MRAQYFGKGFSDAEFRQILRYLESCAKPDSDKVKPHLSALPLTFRYNRAVVEITSQPYTLLPGNDNVNSPEFFRMICLEIEAGDPGVVFTSIVKGTYHGLALLMDRQPDCSYPFIRGYRNSVEQTITAPEQEFELLGKQ